MAASNSVTLTFTANTASLDKGFRDVQQGAQKTETAMRHTSTEAATLGTELEHAGRSARGSAELLRGVGTASVLMGGQIGGTTQNLLYASTAFKEVSKGAGRLVSDFGLVRVAAGGLAIGMAALAVDATSQNKGWSNLGQDALKPVAAQMSIVNDIVHKLPGGLGAAGRQFDSLTSATRVNAGMSRTAAGALNAMADAADNAAAAAAAAVAAMRSLPSDTDMGSGWDVSSNSEFLAGLTADQNPADVAAQRAAYAADQASSAGRAAAGAARSTNAALDAAKAAAKQKLSEWQSVIDSARQVGQDIAKALSPKLDATFNSQDALLSQRKGGVIAGLQDQLRKMKELSKDVDTLAKRGLAPDLLQQIVSAGPDGLDAARELLSGNNVATANSLDKSINKYANHIAVGESTREFNNQPKEIKVKVDVSGGESDLKKLVRKWIRTDGGGNVQLALGGK